MRRFLTSAWPPITLVAICMVIYAVGCSMPEPKYDSKGVRIYEDQRPDWTFAYDGHSYLVFESGMGDTKTQSVVHSPSCPACF